MVFVMPRMSQQDRAIAVGLLEANWSVKAVARRLGVSPKAIRILRDKFERTGAVQDLPRSGRPRVTTRRADRYLAWQASGMTGMTSPAGLLISPIVPLTIMNYVIFENKPFSIQFKITQAWQVLRAYWCNIHISPYIKFRQNLLKFVHIIAQKRNC